MSINSCSTCQKQSSMSMLRNAGRGNVMAAVAWRRRRGSHENAMVATDDCAGHGETWQESGGRQAGQTGRCPHLMRSTHRATFSPPLLGCTWAGADWAEKVPRRCNRPANSARTSGGELYISAIWAIPCSLPFRHIILVTHTHNIPSSMQYGPMRQSRSDQHLQ